MPWWQGVCVKGKCMHVYLFACMGLFVPPESWYDGCVCACGCVCVDVRVTCKYVSE